MPESTNTQPVDERTRGYRVLVAEDEADIGQLVKFTLERRGHAVQLVTNGRDAVDAAVAERPDVIVLDVMMPVMNGHDACREIKNREDTRGIPVIMLSAKTQKGEVGAGMELGATAYLCKPFNPRDLIQKIDEVLGSV